jgi:hypothetical protein
VKVAGTGRDDEPCCAQGGGSIRRGSVAFAPLPLAGPASWRTLPFFPHGGDRSAVASRPEAPAELLG